MAAPLLPIFDGHNDTLLVIAEQYDSDPGMFFQRNEQGHLDLPRAREGGLAGGFFAVFVTNPPEDGSTEDRLHQTDDGFFVEPPPAVSYARSVSQTMHQIKLLYRLAALSDGAVEIVTTADDLARCLEAGTFATILHFEGAEPIDPALGALDVYYRAGLRSLGPVWSRPNAFGYGVPFKYPSTPDTGPGLTDAGKALVKGCNELGIMLDLAHLNERGFWDVAELSAAPLVVTHTSVNALSPTARTLTDAQIDAVAESGGVIGVTYFVADLRADGKWDPNTPLSAIADHMAYIAERVGPEHVAFGSDFNGARIPNELKDVTGLPKLVAALRERGFDDAALKLLGTENWLRVLRATWKD